MANCDMDDHLSLGSESRSVHEFFREFCDRGGWFNADSTEFKEIKNSFFALTLTHSSMDHSLGLSNRLLRHVFCIATPEMDDSGLFSVLDSMVLTRLSGSPTGDFITVLEELVHASVDILRSLQSQFTPAPHRPHYQFSLHQLVTVFRHLCSIWTVPENMSLYFNDPASTLKLWSYHMARVFEDRTIDAQDRRIVSAVVKTAVRNHVSIPQAVDLLGSVENPLTFADYQSGVASIHYELVQDFSVVDSMISKLTKIDSRKPVQDMDRLPGLVTMSTNQMKYHFAHIASVLRLPGSHMILAGQHMCGKQAAARLVADLYGYSFVRLTGSRDTVLSRMRNDMKNALKRAGSEDKSCLIMLSDLNLASIGLLDDVQNLIRYERINHWWTPQEKQQIFGALVSLLTLTNSHLLEDKKENGSVQNGGSETDAEEEHRVFDIFYQNIRKNVHFVLCLDTDETVGVVSFYDLIRRYPALASSFSIHFFQEWDQQICLDVATTIVQAKVTDQQHDRVASALIDLHRNSVQLVNRAPIHTDHFQQRFPQVFVDFVTVFTDIYQRQSTEVCSQLEKFKGCLKQMELCREVVNEARELEEVQRQAYDELKSELGEVSRRRNAQEQETDAEQRALDAAEAEAVREFSQVETEYIRVSQQLKTAEPLLADACTQLERLKKDDITELRGVTKPPMGVILVMELLFLLKNIPLRKQLPERRNEYWAELKVLFNEPKFIPNLLSIDRNGISDETLERMAPLIHSPESSVEVVGRVCKAIKVLASFVHALHLYATAANPIGALTAQYERLLEEKEQKLLNLVPKREMVTVLAGQLKTLRDKQKVLIDKRTALESEMKSCQDRMDRAMKIVNNLKDEREKWQSQLDDWQKKKQSLIGDCLLAATIIRFAGMLRGVHREYLVESTRTRLAKLQLTTNPAFDFTSMLATKDQMSKWANERLPVDKPLMENAVILMHARQWPLIVDPDNVAYKWITTCEKARSLKILKLSDKQLSATIESCMQYGIPVLMDHLESVSDPDLSVLTNYLESRTESSFHVGSQNFDIHPDFFLYVTIATPSPGPKLSANTAVNFAMVDFTITQNALEQEILNRVVAKEKLDLDSALFAVQDEIIRLSAQRADIEHMLFQSFLGSEVASYLDSDESVHAVLHSKTAAMELTKRINAKRVKEAELSKSRLEMGACGIHCSAVLSCLTRFKLGSETSRFSGTWILSLVDKALSSLKLLADMQQQSPQHEDKSILNEITHQWISSFNAAVRQLAFNEAALGLTLNQQLTLALSLTLTVLLFESRIEPEEVKFFIHGHLAIRPVHKEAGSPVSWISNEIWRSLEELEQMNRFMGLTDHIQQHQQLWRNTFGSERFGERSDSVMPSFPKEWERKFAFFHKILVLRYLRPEKVFNWIRTMIGDVLGSKYIDVKPVQLKAVVDSSDPLTPLLVCPSSTSNLALELQTLANQFDVQLKVLSNHTSAEQIRRVADVVEEAVDRGHWVLLQNGQLSTSLMEGVWATLESLEKTRFNHDFRLWMSYDLNRLDTEPLALVQHAKRIVLWNSSTFRGLVIELLNRFVLSKMRKDYAKLIAEKKRAMYNVLATVVVMFHAILLRRYAVLTQYSMGTETILLAQDSDLQLAIDLILHLAEKRESICAEQVCELIVNSIYGLKEHDSGQLITYHIILTELMRHIVPPSFRHQSTDSNRSSMALDDPEMVGDRISMLFKNGYHIPASSDFDDIMQEIARGFPAVESMELYGLRPVDVAVTAQKSVTELLGNLMELYPVDKPILNEHVVLPAAEPSSCPLRSHRGSQVAAITPTCNVESLWDSALRSIQKVLARLPKSIPFELTPSRIAPAAGRRYRQYCLLQECNTLNQLVNLVKCELHQALRCIHSSNGAVSLQQDLFLCLINSRTPHHWLTLSRSGQVDLDAWISEVCSRHELISKWHQMGADIFNTFRFANMFYPGSVVESVRISYAIERKLALEQVALTYQPVSQDDAAVSSDLHLSGLSLKGAVWLIQQPILCPASFDEFHTLPLFRIKPESTEQINSEDCDSVAVNIPVYRFTKASQRDLSQPAGQFGVDTDREEVGASAELVCVIPFRVPKETQVKWQIAALEVKAAR
eukprot:GILJ01006180.1.p1 GENE.GILJ01006180.1~~GILJ01006180.1.p1  ORF type:complete len:2391 (-),score=424.52 GILJ01006180.1:67-6378(-)